MTVRQGNGGTPVRTAIPSRGTTPFDLTGATNVAFAWSSTAGPAVPGPASVWTALVVNPAGVESPTYLLQENDLVGQFLRVIVSWTGPDGLLRSVTSGPTENVVAADPG